MTTRYRSESRDGLITLAGAVAEQTRVCFGGLTASQLNWKPGADQWSIAQCFDHVLTANRSYFPLFEQVLRGKQRSTFWERLPWLPTLWGSLLIRAVSPEARRKLKAPKIFQPVRSHVDEAVIGRFLDQQNEVIGYLKAMREISIEKIRITSPAAGVITYSLLDAFRILIAHEQRHLQQAVRVTAMEGFPKGVNDDEPPGK